MLGKTLVLNKKWFYLKSIHFYQYSTNWCFIFWTVPRLASKKPILSCFEGQDLLLTCETKIVGA